MIIHSYQLRFVTPGFLGGAEQKAEWRTPPLKALLRQWWRIAVAPRFQYDVRAMLRLESALFGSAAEDEDSGRSLVRLRLNDTGSQGTSWGKASGPPWSARPGDPEFKSEEMTYLAWGLVEPAPVRSALNPKKAEGTRLLKIAFPEQSPRLPPNYTPSDLTTAFALIHHFGTLGGRSRNGWGSLSVEPVDDTPPLPLLTQLLDNPGMRPLSERLTHSWATGIASIDSSPLIWESDRTFTSWGAALRQIHDIKRAVRNELALEGHLRLVPRQLLGLPVQDGPPIDARMPSPLRFKVFDPKAGELRIRVYALPHGAPDSDSFRRLREDFNKLAPSVWDTVISTLDEQAPLHRI